MAADQLNKRSNATSVVGHTSREQYRAKKKKLELAHYDLNMRSNISLEWDDKKKSVVAKKEQIGIACRELIPFLDTVPRNVLADVFEPPCEIFELDNLADVLSYEVWQTYLSEKERKFLTQFLPKGDEGHRVVQELLAGNNFYFGNPFLKWGALLCSGSCHPDAVVLQEQCSKVNKKAYYLELRKYHTSMIGILQTWKERLATCKNSENEFMQTIWRSRKDYERSGSTSESCSWAADEKACSSDSPNLTTHGETLRRKGFMDGKYDDSSDGHKVRKRLKKGEKLHKRNIECGDGAKYMSYIKVSKEQHQRVRSSMKHPTSSIQSRSLNNIIGNLDTFCVRPYEVFEEEERQKLHDHWLQLANKDLPAGFKNWRKWQSEKWQLTKSLGQEMKEKLKYLDEDEEKERNQVMLLQQTDNEESDLEDEEKEQSDGSSLHEQMDDVETNHEPSVASEDNEDESSDSIFQCEADTEAANHEPPMQVVHKDKSGHNSGSPQNRHLQQIALLGGNHDFYSMDMDSNNNNVLAKTAGFPPNVSEYAENMNHVDLPVGQGDPLSSASEGWLAVRLPSAYYHHSTPGSHEYASNSELSLGHPQVRQDQPTQVIDLESEMREQDPGRDFLHRQSGGDEPFFSPYSNQDRNELLLQSLVKNPGNSPYHHERKMARLDFHPTGSDIMLPVETSRFPGNLRDSSMPLELMPLELRQKRFNELYMHHNIQDNMYADGGSRYSIPRQEHFSPLNHIQDWAVNSNVNMPTSSSQSYLNGGGDLLSQNWFSGEHRPRDGWPGSEGAVGTNPSSGNGSNVADQSLFSVLSQCNGLRSSGVHYDSVANPERYIQSGNYGGAVPTTSNVVTLPRTATGPTLNYLSGNENTTSVLRTNTIGWMGVPHQNTALQDSLGKPFLRSWNH